MLRRENFCRHLWLNVIDPNMDEAGVARVVEALNASPDQAFHGAGQAMDRMISLGVSLKDIGLVMRLSSYEAVFATLYALEDPGVMERDRAGLHEDLLMADPSGKEGRS